MSLKFKVGDRVRLKQVMEGASYSVNDGGLGTIRTVDDTDTDLPYKVEWDIGNWNWAFAPDLQPAVRTPEAIREDIAALEAELAAATTLKVGDKVTVRVKVTDWRIGDRVLVNGREAVITEIDRTDDDRPVKVVLTGTEEQEWPWKDEITRLDPPLPTDLGELEALAARVAEAIAEAKRPKFAVGDRVRLEATVTHVADESVCIKADKHAGEIWYHVSALTKVQP